jgi:flagellar basal-body rod protein FlgB
LRAATGSTGVGEGIASSVMSRTGRPTPELRYAQPTQTNLDSNTVDMDRERAAFMENAVKYESTLRFINGNVRSMLDAMKSHNQA